MAFIKYVKKGIKKAGRVVKKRYFKGKGFAAPRYKKMLKDVSMLKSMVNAEKEQYAQNISASIGSPTAQTMFTAITNVAEGTSTGQRDGESIKLHSYSLEWSVRQQASRVNPTQIKIWLIRHNSPSGITPTISDFLDVDMFGNRSYTSPRNTDKFKQFSVIASKDIYLPADSGGSGETQQKMGRIGGKFNFHQRYSGTLANTLIWGQMYLVAVCSSGNTTTSTGIDVDTRLNIYFYDN